MSVLITYEYWCDICGEEIRARDQYNIQPMVPAQNMHWPVPANCVGQCVGQSHVCHQCLTLGVDVIVKHRRALQEAEDAIPAA